MLINTIRAAVIGDREAVPTALGPRRTTYVDFTASGRSLSFVEQHIADAVMPLYSNTHSTTSEVGFQSHMYLSESRDIIRDSTNASEKDDVVLFVGRGATGAVNTLAHHLIGPSSARAASSSSWTSSSPAAERAGRNFTQYLDNSLADKDESILALSDSLASNKAAAAAAGKSAAPAARYDCLFPGCSRSFRSAVDLHMHARTHPDGEATAWRLHLHGPSGSGAGSGSSASDGTATATTGEAEAALTASAGPRRPRAVIIVGPYAHHSSILPWQEQGDSNGDIVTLHVKGEGAVASTGGDSDSDSDGWWGLDAVDLHRQIRRAIRIAVLGSSSGSGDSDSDDGSLTSIPAFFASLAADTHAAKVTFSSLAPTKVIGSFTAASNVTGVMVNVDRVTAAFNCYDAQYKAMAAQQQQQQQLQHGAGKASAGSIEGVISCVAWDYAAAAPHTGVDMNPKKTFAMHQLMPRSSTSATTTGAGDAYYGCAKDAAYFSMHKFLGGPSSPGILILKRRLLSSGAPLTTGGGTVFFVHPDGTPRYLANDAEREEAGSPDLLASVRAGLAFHVLRSVGMQDVASREGAMAAAARAEWAAHPNIRILGAENPSVTPRIPIVSFVVASSAPITTTTACTATNNRLLLHWSFVTALLNDVFGIQARGGCLCAGPYLHSLLGISERENEDSEASSLLEERLLHKEELLRPGVVRVSFPYHLSHEAYRYIVDAVAWVATHGERLLWLYTPLHDTGEWRINRSLAWSLLGEGYRLVGINNNSSNSSETSSSAYSSLNTELSSVLGDVTAAATPSAEAAPPPPQAACPFSLRELARAKATIASCTKIPGKEGLQHSNEGHRGGTKTHPRRWLQSLKLRKEDGRIVRPDYRILIDLADDNDIDSKTAGDKAAKATEQQLLDAYRCEAWLMLAAAWLKRPTNAAALSHHQAIVDASTASSSSSSASEGHRLARWYALGTDLAPEAGGLSQRSTTEAGSDASSSPTGAAGSSAVSICRALQVYSPPAWLKSLGSSGSSAAADGLRTPDGAKAEEDEDEDGRFTNSESKAWVRPDSRLVRFLLSQDVDGVDSESVERMRAEFNGLTPKPNRDTTASADDGDSAALTEEERMGAGSAADAAASATSGGVDFFYARRDGLKAAEGASSSSSSKPPKAAGTTTNKKKQAPAGTPSNTGVVASPAAHARGSGVDGDDDRLAKAAARASNAVASTPSSSAVAAASPSTSESAAGGAGDAVEPSPAAAASPSQGTSSDAAFRERAKEYALTSQAMKRLLPDPLANPNNSNKGSKKGAAKDSGASASSDSASAGAVSGAGSGSGSAAGGGNPLAKVYMSLRRDMLEAIQDFSMIHEGDRLLIGLSGGKDSMSMLIMLLYIRERFPVRFDIGCCTVDPQYSGFDPSPLKKFLKELNIPYYYRSEGLIDLAGEKMTSGSGNRESICSWCSRMKRGILYSTARQHGYNVLVLGQHADDAAESFIMSAFRNGLLRTMKAHYLNDDGDVRIIRPLIYARARTTREFAHGMKLPVISDNCPACFAAPQIRADTAKLLAYEESKNPGLFASLKRAMKVLFTDGGARAVRKLQKRVDAEGEHLKQLRTDGLNELRESKKGTASPSAGLTAVVGVSAKIGLGGLLSCPPLYTALPSKPVATAAGEDSRPTLAVVTTSGAYLAAAAVKAAGGTTLFSGAGAAGGSFLPLGNTAGDDVADNDDSEEEEERKLLNSGACPTPAVEVISAMRRKKAEATPLPAVPEGSSTATGEAAADEDGEGAGGSQLIVEDDGSKLRLTYVKR